MLALMTKDSVLTVKLDDRDRERLSRVVAHYELSQSAVIRLLIKRAAEELEAGQMPAPSLTLVKPPAKPLEKA